VTYYYTEVTFEANGRRRLALYGMQFRIHKHM